jgi:hypothetical protein
MDVLQLVRLARICRRYGMLREKEHFPAALFARTLSFTMNIIQTVCYVLPSLNTEEPFNECFQIGDVIARVLKHDLGRKPSALVVIGTSLKVSGVRSAVKSLARRIHEANGIVILINDTSIGKEWNNVFTHWIKGKCEIICKDLKDTFAIIQSLNTH